jgi:hypothetical protein
MTDPDEMSTEQLYESIMAKLQSIEETLDVMIALHRPEIERLGLTIPPKAERQANS